ncbi:hypothetical protein CKM354_000048200 [Cercospora kikuchii]|uniref:Uncharacterized protein n=1 Tax=Cercospora kikuchii TaxID=84275 RepID=A0A9P3FBN6_9PEZI|nr:uncharacterized protein CKM354_000048200 [Cercospora kikuchii]GIZ37019.1 hypothetical protein CKM354_000048200 [Cercospora kikuchii]
MPPRTTGNSSNMGDNIVLPSTSRWRKLSRRGSRPPWRTASNKGEKWEPELEGATIRDQILTNASFLYQLLGGLDSDGHSFELVTCGVGAKVAGCVVYMKGDRRHVLLRGPESRGEPKALQELLAMTSKLMHDKWTEFCRPADNWRQVNGRGNSYYCTSKR